jgi:hypothetical protein
MCNLLPILDARTRSITPLIAGKQRKLTKVPATLLLDDKN